MQAVKLVKRGEHCDWCQGTTTYMSFSTYSLLVSPAVQKTSNTASNALENHVHVHQPLPCNTLIATVHLEF